MERQRERKPTSLSHTSDVVADGYDVVEMIAKLLRIKKRNDIIKSC